MYADVDETTGDALTVSEPIPLPALNVSDKKIHKSMLVSTRQHGFH